MNEDIKEKVRNEYDRFMTGLKESIMNIERIKGENSEFDKIQKSFIETIQKQYSIVSHNSIETVNSAIWDHLVIAFFGETNAGKSTIIESLRILYREKPSQISQIDNNADGLIVGDGRSDFTKVYNEYNLSINGRPFTLIDVPGIEGKEEDFKDEIKKALDKAHCVFYVQGHNKQPDTATAEKIKKYLRDWVNVYSIYNVRGGSGNYDEVEERETLITDQIKKTEELISNTFKSILGNKYKGNITLQGLLAMCAIASFASSRPDLQRTQKKLINHFENKNNLYDFSRFSSITQLIAEKSSNFKDEIVEANKSKMIALAHNAFCEIDNEMSNQNKTISDFMNILTMFKGEVALIMSDCKRNIDRDVNALNIRTFNNFKEKVFEIIDNSNDSNEQKKRNIIHHQSNIVQTLRQGVNQIIVNNAKVTSDRIQQKKKSLDSIPIAYIGSNFSFEVNCINYNLKTDEILKELNISVGDIASFAVSVVGGAATGSVVPGVGTVIGGLVGGLVGGLSHIAKKSFLGDGGKGAAKEKARKEIEQAQIKNRQHLQPIINIIKTDLNDRKFLISNKINNEIRNLDNIKNSMQNGQTNIRVFVNDIKNKKYGNI